MRTSLWSLSAIFIICITTHPALSFGALHSCCHDQTGYRKALRTVFLAHRTSAHDESHVHTLNELCGPDYLNLNLRFERSRAHPSSVTAKLVVDGTERGIIPNYILETIYYNFVNPESSHYGTAYVREITDETPLHSEEQAFLDRRSHLCANTISDIVGEYVPADKAPRIGVACSGGGLRAALATTGVLKGLNDEGLLDAITYIAGLSGSAWTITPWLAEGTPYDTFHKEMLYRASHTMLHKPIEDHYRDLMHSLPDISERLLAKVIFKQRPSIIDIYGYLLAQNLFNVPHRHDYNDIDATKIAYTIATGNAPFPINTALFPHKTDAYSWVEFTPYEVACNELEAGVPAWAFGRKFKKGVSVNSAPAMPLSLMMGIWGSAISVSLHELYDFVLSSLEPKELFDSIKPILTESFLSDLRLFAAYTNNMTYKMQDHPYRNKKRFAAIDAGIDKNIPLKPLLDQRRNLDIIIVCDASGAVSRVGGDMKRAVHDAREEGYAVPYLDDEKFDQPYAVFHGEPTAGIPTIIYISMNTNPDYDPSFDPLKESNDGFLQTFNFSYSEKQAEQISGLFEYTFKQASQDIRNAINRHYKEQETA